MEHKEWKGTPVRVEYNMQYIMSPHYTVVVYIRISSSYSVTSRTFGVKSAVLLGIPGMCRVEGRRYNKEGLVIVYIRLRA